MVLVHPERYYRKQFTCLCSLIRCSVDYKAFSQLASVLESIYIVAYFVYTSIIQISRESTQNRPIKSLHADLSIQDNDLLL